MKELFVFWQFNGDNRSFCNQHCPYCYGHDYKDNRHYWNGDVTKWEKAFERLNRDIYFNFSYGEPMGASGFYECVNMIGRHPTWALNVITNLSYNPDYLISTRLAQEGRLFINACWHPLGVNNREIAWDNFRSNLLKLRMANIKVHVAYVWYKPQIKLFPEYFEWFDKHDFRVHVRRYVNESFFQRLPYVRRFRAWVGKCSLENYTEIELKYLYAQTSPKLQKYGLDLASTYHKTCLAGKDMILVNHIGMVGLCACCYGSRHTLGNIFDSGFKLNDNPTKCPSHTCGGCFGLLVIHDEKLGLPHTTMWRDTFMSQVENIEDGHPVVYPNWKEMLELLEELKCQKE